MFWWVNELWQNNNLGVSDLSSCNNKTDFSRVFPSHLFFFHPVRISRIYVLYYHLNYFKGTIQRKRRVEFGSSEGHIRRAAKAGFEAWKGASKSRALFTETWCHSIWQQCNLIQIFLEGRSEFFLLVKTFYSTLFFFFIVDNFKAPKRELEKPFRFCVSDVYKGNLVEIMRDMQIDRHKEKCIA